METILKSLVLSAAAGFSCNIFFRTLLPLKQRQKAYLSLAGFSAAFLVMAFSEAPGYLLQPFRVIVLLGIVIQIFFSVGIRKTIVLSVFWCALFWVLNLLAVSLVYILPGQYGSMQGLSDWICGGLLFGLSAAFQYYYRKKPGGLVKGWGRFAWVPVLSLLGTVLITISVWYGDSRDKSDVLLISIGYMVINVLVFCFIGNILAKEAEVQKVHFMQEKLQNQMELYQNMQESDQKRRQYLHDYKNQLGCIQGMLTAGRTEEALAYIEELNGSIRRGEDCVNTSHLVVNTVLNQKYLYAKERGITLVMAVSDLSALRMEREDLAALLVNLLDNGIEACEKLDENKVIRFKMTLEEGELTISVRNPVAEPVLIKGKTVVTTKEDRNSHGIGLMNIHSVIEKNHGTSVMECRDGWFCFSAVIPEMKIQSI